MPHSQMILGKKVFVKQKEDQYSGEHILEQFSTVSASYYKREREREEPRTDWMR